MSLEVWGLGLLVPPRAADKTTSRGAPRAARAAVASFLLVDKHMRWDSMTLQRWIVRLCLLVISVAGAAPARAQYVPVKTSDPATGEKYHFELSGIFWQPGTDIVISSTSLTGEPGTAINLTADLGVEDQSFYEVRGVIRPARKHKFRVDYIPIQYSADKTLEATIIFNGQRFDAGVPVHTELDWKMWNLFYEYDFVYRDRGFAGILVGVKYNDVRVDISSPLTAEFTSAKGPIPAVGGIGRVYFAPNICVTGQVTLFDMPDEVAEDWNGDMYDIDIYGTVNLTNNFGISGGYRSYEVDYRVELDSGRIDLSGWYIGGAVRF